MSSSVHANNKIKNVLVFGKYFVQGLYNTTIYAEKLCSINFTKNDIKFRISLHYNGANSYLFVNGTDTQKILTEIVATPLCLGNISKEFSVDNM